VSARQSASGWLFWLLSHRSCPGYDKSGSYVEKQIHEVTNRLIYRRFEKIHLRNLNEDYRHTEMQFNQVRFASLIMPTKKHKTIGFRTTRYFHRYFQVQLLRIILMINRIQVVWWQGTHLRESRFIVCGHITKKRNGQCWLQCTDQTLSDG